MDFGCGHDHNYQVMTQYIFQHLERNPSITSCDAYDLHYRPDGIVRDFYDTITCIYVLNVLPDYSERLQVFRAVRDLLKPGGRMFFAVRNDREHLRGWTSKGTWQGHIKMDPRQLLHNTASYCIYQFPKEVPNVRITTLLPRC